VAQPLDRVCCPVWLVATAGQGVSRESSWLVCSSTGLYVRVVRSALQHPAHTSTSWARKRSTPTSRVWWGGIPTQLLQVAVCVQPPLPTTSRLQSVPLWNGFGPQGLLTQEAMKLSNWALRWAVADD